MKRSGWLLLLACSACTSWSAEWVNISDPVTAVVKPDYAGMDANLLGTPIHLFCGGR